MEIVSERKDITVKALKTLEEALIILKDQPHNPLLHRIIRDSIIKRFEYTIDCFWKYLRNHVEENHTITLEKISPKSTFRACLRIGIINENEFNQLIQMIDDRNLTCHTYGQELAKEICERIKNYVIILRTILQRF